MPEHPGELHAQRRRGRRAGDDLGRERLPDAVADLLEGECGPCHFAGGEVVDMLDLSQAELVIRRAGLIGERVFADAEQAALRAWIDGLAR